MKTHCLPRIWQLFRYLKFQYVFKKNFFFSLVDFCLFSILYFCHLHIFPIVKSIGRLRMDSINNRIFIIDLEKSSLLPAVFCLLQFFFDYLDFTGFFYFFSFSEKLSGISLIFNNNIATP